MTDESTPVPRIASVPDPSLVARVVRRTPLHYRAGADPALDRPAHVRAGSSVARLGGRLVVVQDDANFFALVDPDSGDAEAITLAAGAGGVRQFDEGRGNKRHKLDLEACVVVPGDGSGASRLLVFGSGSKARRESVVDASGLETSDPSLVMRHLPGLYAALRAAPDFAGSQLNVEGAIFLAGRGEGASAVRLFGRGNGAARGTLQARNATCDLDWPALDAHLSTPRAAPPPALRHITQYDLGAVESVPFGFTDAAVMRDGAMLYVAAAEASRNAIRDGTVAGSALGVIHVDARGCPVEARFAVVHDAHGQPFTAKIEGVALSWESPARCWVVVDTDDPAAPSELCEVALEGRW